MSNKVILITGASRGIGAATAIMAAERGYDVVVNYVSNATAANQVVAKVQALGQQALAIQADISQPEQIEAMFGKLQDSFGTLHALVNNAAMLELQSRVEDLSADRIMRVLQTNVLGSFICAQQAIKMMSTQYGGQGGAIVNVSSAASRLGSANEYVDYAASKGAIDSFTIGLAQELAAEGIRVNAVRPGFIDTDMHASGGEPDRIERVKQFVPMQRGGTAREVAAAILWLLSDEASFTTGSFIEVAGGK